MKPSDSEVIEVFTELAPRYAQVVNKELKRFWGWGYQDFIERVLHCIPATHEAILLDIATGTGSIPLGLLEKGFDPRNIHGLDITYAMLSLAKRIMGKNYTGIHPPNLVCGSGMMLPYRDAAFTNIICGLATHHMQVRDLVAECSRVLQEGGTLLVADAGGSLYWKIPGVKLLLRVAAYIYFSLNENRKRAWAEAKAVSNVLSPEEWGSMLAGAHFHRITIEKMKSRFFFVPSPLIIQASKA